MPVHSGAPLPLDASLWLPLAITLAEVLVAVRVLHGAVARAMRARGMAWRLRDTALVSPLLWIGLALFFGALNHAMLRYAIDATRGTRGVAHLGLLIAVAAGGLATGWFGGRAVGKLY